VRRRRSRRKEHASLTFFLSSLSNPASAEFRCCEEDEGRIRRGESEGECKQYYPVECTRYQLRQIGCDQLNMAN
jgi:hypothetical protein